ncbi:XdhC family protein [Alteromonadaceae bacterium BrNp21-10]|nr:XdhC family protein [Alteromonadaceae bacterium BrNp21-10]
MANHLCRLLEQWQPQKNEFDWVLATIIKTDGSSYRKAGAMMLINSMGQYFGLLSGGCLESDIMRQAQQCWQTGCNRIIEYDMREEEDLAWQLGLGCGGMVRILLQPVIAANDYLQLDQLHHCLSNNQAVGYRQQIDQQAPQNTLVELNSALAGDYVAGACDISHVNGVAHMQHNLTPPIHLAVFGAGVDARPVVAIAGSLGWQITLIDPRAANGRQQYFPAADEIVKIMPTDNQQAPWLQHIDAALILTHNIDLDAAALLLVQQSSAKYVGLLGPIHRTDRVLAQAKLTRVQLTKPLANPVGLRLGGELPESIALSMVSEVHAYLHQADAQSISQQLFSANETSLLKAL